MGQSYAFLELYEDALKAFESTSMASQTLLFPETLEFSPDDFDVLFDVLPYLEKIGFKIKKQDNLSVRIDAIPSEMAIGNGTKRQRPTVFELEPV